MSSMVPYYERDGITIYVGDNREVLPHVGQAHAVVTDPPYGLSFMGKGWDHQVPGVEFWQAIGEAMLPGAHLLAFGGTRTYHRMAVAIEDAGYEIRDTLQWLYGSGFPKSHDVSKAIDKAAGAEREVVGKYTVGGMLPDRENFGANDRSGGKGMGFRPGDLMITAPATPEAEQWQGWGTALKPSYEPIIMARSPFKGTVAANVLAHGTGAINVDASRIGHGNDVDLTEVQRQNADTAGMNGIGKSGFKPDHQQSKYNTTGRWPANVILDEAAALQIGEPARYFYCAKSSRRERNAGLEGMPEHPSYMVENGSKTAGAANGIRYERRTVHQNSHPTVKPLALMRYLITMVTPPGGIVLDPFAGSGSTLVAAAELGFNAIGIELSEEYAEIAARRGDHAIENRDPQLTLEGIA